MYRQDESTNDVNTILNRINEIVTQEHTSQPEPQDFAKLSRKEQDEWKKQLQESSKLIPFNRFLKVLLDFSLMSHEKFLRKFVKLFLKEDKERKGVLDESQFINLIRGLNIVEDDDQFNIILHKADPHNNKIITFSDCVQVFTDTEVEIEGEENGTKRIISMNVIEKINNLG